MEAIRDDEALLVLKVVETRGEGLGDALVDSADRVNPCAHIESAELDFSGGDARMRGDGLRVDEQSVQGESGVDIAQGVHDALERDASQRPAAEREVEPLAREV